MAWQLHYTSAQVGPSGQAGFQYVAESPGLPAGLATYVLPYLTYRPPPSLPTAPSRLEIQALPAALAFGRAGDRFVLTRCVYLGQDYSGRFGNFLGHALVLEADDLTGLRPIELWQAPLWSDAPAPAGQELPLLHDLSPGAGLDPDSMGLWLRAHGPQAYERLTVLLELTCQALAQRGGRIVLVSADHEEVVRWIAVISYSLPWHLVTRLSFVTYSGDPSATLQTIVGTSPDVWLPDDLDATVVRLDRLERPVEPGRFASTVTELWRLLNFDGLDELASFGAADLETAAALVALCASGTPLNTAEQDAVAGLLCDGGSELPHWVWPQLAGRAELLDHGPAAALASHAPAEAADLGAVRCVMLALSDPALPLPGRLPSDRHLSGLTEAARQALTAANDLGRLVSVLRIADQVGLPVSAPEVQQAADALVDESLTEIGSFGGCPPRWRERVIEGLVSGLERAPSRLRSRLLSSGAAALLADVDLRRAPRTAVRVINWRLSSGLDDRVTATLQLVGIAGDSPARDERDDALIEIWRDEPTSDECLRLIRRLGASQELPATLCALPRRAFVRLGLKSVATREIAELVVTMDLPQPAIDDAKAVLAVLDFHRDDARHKKPEIVRAAVERLTPLMCRDQSPFTGSLRRWTAKALTERDPRFRADLLCRLTHPAREWLLHAWLDANPGRSEQAALLEIAIRLRSAGEDLAPLTNWAHALVSGWNRLTSLEGHFKKDPALVAGLKEFGWPPKRRFSRWGGR